MLDQFEQLLKESMGLDAASIGAAAVERAVLARTVACGLSELPAYWARVSSCAAERLELIEAVVVPETWFFRDREAFTALARLALAGLRAPSGGPLRIVSLPCSTGEEPYSITMALLEAGFAPDRLDIRGVDISERALARARRGVYGKNSFRGDDHAFRDRWFSPGSDGYRLADAVRSCVRFDRANLFDDAFPLGPSSCDFVFCRNLLIYFDRPTQTRAVAVLASLLTRDGVLFVGPSEASLLLDLGFESARIPLAFAFRKPSATARSGPAAAPASARQSVPPHRPRRPARSAFSAAPEPRRAPPDPATTAVEEIRRLADLGRLDEAARSCEAYLRERGPSAEPLYLLGLIRDAGGARTQAAACYRKALYLDPSHREALAHLAALLESEGDGRGARVLGERLRRLNGMA